MKALKCLMIGLVILINSGCALSAKTIKKDKNKVIDSYLEAVSCGRVDAVNYIKESLKVNKTLGYVKPYVPVVQSPVVRMVWIPAHKSDYSQDTLISGHWVYVMVQGAEWFIDKQSGNKGKIPVIMPYKQGMKKL